ncbi:GerMN domain-containing protein [Caldicellulosiruptoraceae bacterium PP1]
MCQIVEIKNGELRVIYNQGEFYYRYNLLNNTYNDKYDVILKEPIKKGTTWYSKDRNKRYINAINKKINTPFKNIQGVEVITEGKDYKIYDYFVKNLGLVKTVFVANQSSIETTLEKIEKNALVTQIVKFYYPNINNNKIEYEEKMVSFQTNDSVPEKFLMYLRNPSQKSHFKIFDSKTKINKLILNDNIAILDISSEFINYLNSIKQKTLILQSLVNTFGNYYNVNKVKIIVNNNVIYENKISLMNH